MNSLSRVWWTAKAVGWDNLPRRLLQAWRVRGGYLRRRLDPRDFSDEAFAAAGGAIEAHQGRLWARRVERFLPSPSPTTLRAVVDDEPWLHHVVRVAQTAVEGDYPYFGRWSGRLGWPPRFNHDTVDGADWSVGVHWLDSAYPPNPPGDIKMVWEPSRLSLAFVLGRAFARDGDERWAQAFWQLFDAWDEQNPPQLSVAWACGQEIAFRLMALLFGAAATLGTPFATPARLRAMTRLAWQSGKHIQININQARMQGNNHALSEAAGLWSVALLFDELAEAPVWREQAREVLAAECARQVYADGSYVQHSLNYHRVMLDDLLWAVRLGELAHQPAPQPVIDALKRSAQWLLEMIDPVSGRVPTYGANDGANVLPLACCDYDDFRPVAQAAGYYLHRRRPLPAGPWDEKLLWLWGPGALDTPPQGRQPARAFHARAGGYFVLRGQQSWAMTRCHSYRDRPSQADMLHVDLFWRGQNVLHDAGSYRYRCREPWNHYFQSTAAHNTVQLDGQDQMVKGPRFLWFEWTRSRLLQFALSPGGRCGCFEGEHYGYRRLGGRLTHRRLLCRIDDAYVVVDTVLGEDRHDVALRWHLCDATDAADAESGRTPERAPTPPDEPPGRRLRLYDDLTLSLIAPPGFVVSLSRGQEPPAVEGWQSRFYGLKEPCPVLSARAHADLPVRLVTLVAPADSTLDFDPAHVFNPAAPLLLRGVNDAALADEIERTCGGRLQVSRD